MERRKYLAFWVVTALVLVGFTILVKGVLLPFVIGMMVAYFLDPTADKMEAKGFSRSTSTLVITVAFFLIVTSIGMLMLPFLVEQLGGLMAMLPEYAQDVYAHTKPFVEKFSLFLDRNHIEGAEASVSSVAADVAGLITAFIAKLLKSGLGVINLFSLLFVTPVVAYYMLRDWDHMKASIFGVIPRKSSETITKLLAEIDDIISGYIRGQTIVCLSLGMFYGIALTLAGLQFGFLIGFMTGVLAFIPYAGVLAGMTIGILVAFFQFDEIERVAIVLVIFMIGQFLEGNFLTPRIVGDKVKLHPVWIIFGLLAGGSLFGFTGVLVAVPVSAVIGVLVRFGVSRYKHSSIYYQS